MEIQRQQLTEFLKSARARLSPTDLGLPDPSRRRTPGLRREDVAALAGVSVTWYTWLEQGRQIRVSAEVLERICATLRLSADEREYLFALVQHRPAPPVLRAADEASPTLLRMVNALGVPALVKTLRWDVIGWNELVTRTFRDWGKIPPERRNLLRVLLVDDKSYREDPATFEATARRVLAKFRVDYSQAPSDPAFEQLIAELDQGCPIFRQLWNSPEVLGRSEAVAFHPVSGGLTFEHSSYVPEGHPTLRVVVFVPHDEVTAGKVAASLRDINSSKRPSERARIN